MHIRFFVGEKNKEIIPEKSSENTGAHYAWCLEQLLINLKKNNDEATRKNILVDFETNMNMMPGTKKMLADVSSLFAALVQSKPLPSNEYIINCLKGIPLPKSRSYISYSMD